MTTFFEDIGDGVVMILTPHFFSHEHNDHHLGM